MPLGSHSPDDTWLLSSFRLGVPDEALGTAAAGCAASASATADAAAAASDWSAGSATEQNLKGPSQVVEG